MISRPRSPLARRRRRSARLALYASLGVTVGLLALVYLWMQPRFNFGGMTSWAEEDWASYPEVRMLQEYIRIDTRQQTPGGTLAGAEWFADQLRDLGIEPEYEIVGGEANVWGIIEGESREAVVLHHHIDVEPVPDPELWTYPPFGGVIRGPFITGRGAFDMKSVAVAQLFAARHLLASLGPGEKPRRSVILLATSSEESGSDEGTRWLLRERPDLVDRFAVVLTEGGVVEGISSDELKYWGTEFVQRRIVDVDLCGPRAALETLAADLEELGLRRGNPKLVPEVETFLEVYGSTRTASDLRRALSHPRRLLRDPQAFAELSPYQASFFVNQTYLAGPWGPPGAATLRVRFTLLPGEEPDRVIDELLPHWIRHGLSMQVYDEGGATGGSPLNHWAFEAIEEVMAEYHPGVPHGPHVLTVTFSDARFLRAAGIPTYGFSPFGTVTADVVRVRSSASLDERLLLPGYRQGVELYGTLLLRMAEGQRG